MENENGNFNQVLLDREQFKTISTAISKECDLEEHNKKLKPQYKCRHTDIEDEKEINGELFLGMSSVSCEVDEIPSVGRAGALKEINQSNFMENKELTFGEKAVGLTFNPAGNSLVQEVKESYAKIIDTLHAIRTGTESAEVKRLMSVAITEAQTAQMWAVKGITWQD
jgi:hypothetical protein